MSFAKKRERAPRDKRAKLSTARVGSSLLVRTLLVGLLAIAGAAWALARHYTYRPPPMRVPVEPHPGPAFDGDAGEVPVPDLLTPDGEAP